MRVPKDMNAKVGSNNIGREVIMRKQALSEMNKNGEMFADFCGMDNMVSYHTLLTAHL